MRVIVLADDLTGANAAASRLKRQGLPSQTHLLHANAAVTPASLYEDGVHVLDLDTRDQADGEAARRMAAAAALIGGNADLLGLRIDSTLRGPIAASLNVLLSEPGRLALIVPAFPASGRTTRGGIHYVHGIKLAETEVAQDPVCPVTTSSVAAWIGGRLGARTATLGLDTVRRGAAAIAAWLSSVVADAVPVVFCDAETDRDIDAIARAAVALRQSHPGLSLLPVDPGPFTAAVLGALCEPARLSPRVFGIVGSVMDTSRQQMDFVESGGYAFTLHYTGQPAHALLAAFEQAPRGARALLLRTDTATLDADQRLLLHDDLAGVFEGVVARFPTLRGYLLSGGETAGRLLAHAGASSLRIQGEIQPLIILSRIVNGPLGGAFLVTKGGTVGTRSAIADAIGCLYDALADDTGSPTMPPGRQAGAYGPAAAVGPHRTHPGRQHGRPRARDPVPVRG